MANAEKRTSPQQLPQPSVWITVLAAIAFAVSLYLLWHSTLGKSPLAGCGEGGNCDEVLQTKWGSWFGIPVSAGGLLTYGAILAIVISMRKKSTDIRWLLLTAFAVMAGASGLWFVALQKFVVESYCWYCMSIHTCGILIAFFVLKGFPFRKEPAGKKKKDIAPFVPGKPAAMAVVAGIAAVGVLAAGQMYSPTPDMPPVAPIASAPSTGTTSTSAEPPPVAGNDVILASGKIRLPLAEYPRFGEADSPTVLAHFFDFTCPACRDFHPQLMQSFQSAANTTALLMVPVPLDAECNPAIKETGYSHRNACKYAEIGLALWNLKPELYDSYDQFIFQGEYPPPINSALQYAENLAGKEQLDAALGDPKVQQTLRYGLSLFYSPAVPQKALPAMVTKDDVVVGFPPPGMLPRMFNIPVTAK